MHRLFFSKKILPLLIILLGVLAGYMILDSGKHKPKRILKQDTKRFRTVQTSILERTSVIPTWTASGFVIAAESVKIHPRVSGNIEFINPLAIPGGLLKKGQWLASLETIEYQLAYESKQAELEQAKASFELAVADQTLAREELHLLGNNSGLTVDQSLVLREPQLTAAKAKIAIAKNNLKKAELNRARTRVSMPFDGKVVSKTVGQGSKVSTNTTLFSVVNTDVYWLEVKIPHKFFKILDKQQPVTISQSRLWGEGVHRKANFVSVLPELDSKDRQVKVLLSIETPLAEDSEHPTVFINDFLNVQLMGKPIKNAWTIKHSWLQADHTIWVVDQNSTLQKRHVEVLFKGRDDVYVRTKIKQGDRALAEKPGIASIGLVVKTRKNRVPSLAKKQDRVKNQKSINKKGHTDEI